MKSTLVKWIREKKKELEKVDQDLFRLAQHKVELEKVISGLEIAAEALPREETEKKAEKELRNGSDMFKVRAILKAIGKPLHIDKIIERLGESPSKTKKQSLVGQLGAYVRREEIFTRPAPNTFGLYEFGKKSYLDSKFYEAYEYEKSR